ncbi:hypothetical protein SDC9_28819 [bioreactor metagenome]|uniref:Uncharacterized protein n=1 Tax=bioreactor metagenome TaxID=1076179 RepID=A0A644UUX5_9ZZZZ
MSCLSRSVPIFAHHQSRIGAAEAEAVRQHRVELHVLAQRGGNLLGPDRRVKLGDVGRGGDEAALHHQEAIDRLVHAGGAQAVAGERLGRGDRRHRALAEDAAHRIHLGHVAGDRRGAMRVDIADLAAFGQGVEGKPHRAFAALARGRNHVIAVRGGAVTGELGIDLGAARLRVFKLLEHHDAAAARDDEAVARHVERPARGLGRVVVFRAHRPHRVEQAAERPVQLLAAAGEDDVLLAHLDQLGAVADAMRRGRAGRGDRIVHALDLVGRGEAGRGGRGHAARHHERPHALRRALGDDDLMRLEEVRGRGTARTDDQPGARVRHVVRLKPGIGDRLLHRQEGIGGAWPHEAQVALVDMVLERDLRLALDLAAEAMLGVIGREDDARAAGLQAGSDFGSGIADRRDDAQTGDDDAAHGGLLSVRGSALGERDLHVLDDVDHFAIGLDDAVGDAHGQPAGLQRLGEIDLVGQHLAIGAHHAGELHLADAKRIAPPLPAAPAEVEAGQLPQPVKAETAGHDRVAREMAFEEPQVRGDVEFGDDMALAMQPAIGRDLGDAVHHQHRRRRQLGIARPEQLAARAFQQILFPEARRKASHRHVSPQWFAPSLYHPRRRTCKGRPCRRCPPVRAASPRPAPIAH